MDSLVKELQRDCLEADIGIATLLRKALVIAKKLKIEDFEEWIELELKGYKEFEQLPEYRMVSGELKGLNPYRGWQPILIPDEEMGEIFQNRPVYEPITQLCDLVERSRKQESPLRIQLSESIKLQLMKSIGHEMEIAYMVDSSQYKKIIEEVKNIVLNWSLELEEDGILGNDMSFSSQEKEAAEDNIYSTYNFYGDQDNFQVQQNTKNSEQKISVNDNFDFDEVRELVELVENKYKELKLEEDDKEEILNELREIKQELNDSSPNRQMIEGKLESIKNIAKGVAGDLIASGIVSQINSIL